MSGDQVDELVPVPEVEPVPIHVALARATAQVNAVGKDARNEAGGYAARSIDGVLDAVHGPLTANGILLLPTVLDRHYEARQSSKGGTLHFVLLTMSYRFVGPMGDELVVAPIYGEAMDSSDKATNKAMSVALKYLLIQVFTLPVTGDRDDPDTSHHETAGDAPAWASPQQVAELAARVAHYQRVVGRNTHPPAWIEAELWPVRKMLQNGAYLRVVEQAHAILDAEGEALGVNLGSESVADSTGVGPAEPVTEPVGRTGTDAPVSYEPCDECGTRWPRHTADCSKNEDPPPPEPVPDEPQPCELCKVLAPDHAADCERAAFT